MLKAFSKITVQEIHRVRIGDKRREIKVIAEPYF